jgi:serine/threonine protein kinase
MKVMAKPAAFANDIRRSQIGKYQLLAHIATGGMGIIYKAVDEETSQTVALKILLPALAHHPLSLEQFRREAGRFAKLRHENIVSLYEFGEANGIFFLALEFVHGIDLHEYISRKGQLDPPEACALLLQAVRALGYLHQQKIVHRDVKPSNFLVTRVRRTARGGARTGMGGVAESRLVKLIDLGLARDVCDEEMRLTRTGFMVGTIDYIAPEQARDGRLADFRSDIYSLGCTFYHMLSGRPPFSEGSIPERVIKHQEAAPPDIRLFNPNLSPSLVDVLQRMLAKKPNDRYQDLRAVLSDLTSAAPGAVQDLRDLSPEVWNGQPLSVSPADPGGRYRGRGAGLEGVKVPAAREEEEIDHSSPLSRDITAKQRQAALGQFERANHVIALRGYDYGIHLLLSCCRLDPANLIYRQFLRRLEKFLFQNKLRSNRLSWLTTLPAKFLFQAAWKSRQYLKVIEYGERILVRDPWDIKTQMIMAEAAEYLGLTNLAMWILEQAWQSDSHTRALNRALERLYEKRGHYAQAISLLKLMIRENPDDGEALGRLQNLAAEDTLVRGQYEKIVGKRLQLAP